MSKKCPKCGESNAESQYFCKKCGGFLREDLISEPEIFESAQFKIMRLIENLKNNYPHEKIIWNDTVDLYARQMERLQALASMPEIKPEANSETEQEKDQESEHPLFGDMRRFLSRCRNPEFQIAFVGTIKTGKSTLINALLEKDFASIAATPETAALTKFRYSKQDYIKITFYSRKEWESIWKSLSKNKGNTKFEQEYDNLNAGVLEKQFIGREPEVISLKNEEIQQNLLKWTSSKYPEHLFVREVEVGISNLPDGIPPEVVFVDTPGLSDPVAYRSNITKNYIKSANAVFVCIEARKMQSQEIGTISSVLSFSAHNKKKVHIIATRWDDLDPKDWTDLKELYISQLKGPGFYGNESDAQENLVHSAALIDNLCRVFNTLDEKTIGDKLIAFASKMDLVHIRNSNEVQSLCSGDPKILNSLRDFSNIRTIREIIKDRLIKNYLKLLNEDIAHSFSSIVSLLCNLQKMKEEGSQRLIELSEADVQTIERKMSEYAKGVDENQSSQKALENLSKKLSDNANELLDKVFDAYKNKQKKSKGK